MSKKTTIILIILWIAGLILSVWVDSGRFPLHLTDPEELISYVDDSGQAVCETERMAFDAGTYVFAISYEGAGDGAVFEVVSDSQMTPDGQHGTVYAEVPMSPDEDRARAEITFDTDVTGVVMRITGAGEDTEYPEIVWRSTSVYHDTAILYVLWSVLIAGLIFVYVRRRADFHVYAIIAAVAVVTTLPFFNDFLIVGHDIDFHLSRLEGITKSIRLGELPMWINPTQNSEYGYSSSVMYPQFFLYIPAILHMFGLSLLNSYKVLMFMINLMAAGAGYLGFKGLFKNREAGIMGALLWGMSMYRLDSVFIRAAVGEALAMAVLPILFWGMYELLFGDASKWWVAVIGFTAVMKSHMLSVVIYVAVAVVFFVISMIVQKDRLERLKSSVIAAAMFLVCNLSYIVPFLDYYMHGAYNGSTEQLSNVHLKDRTVYFSQMFNHFAHYVGHGNLAAGTTQDEMPLTFGLLPVVGLIAVCGVIYAWRRTHDGDEAKAAGSSVSYRLMCGCAAAAIALCLLMSPLIPWDILISFPAIYDPAASIQFVWRLMGPASVFFTVMIVAVVRFVTSHMHRDYSPAVLIVIIAVAAVLGGWPSIDTATDIRTYPGPQYVAFNREVDYLYLDSDGDRQYVYERGNCVTTSDDDMSVTAYAKRGTSVSCSVTGSAGATEAYVEVPLYYYPGYRAAVNGTPATVIPGDHHIVRVLLGDVSGGSADIDVDFHAPVYWMISLIISWGVIIGWIVWSRIRGSVRMRSGDSE